MSAPWLLALLMSSATTTSTAAAAKRPSGSNDAIIRGTPLTLVRAVQAALRTEPLVASARLARDRSRLAHLRAQLDRFSLRVDAQLQELWFKTGIGGGRDDAGEGGLGLSNVSARLDVPLFSGLRVESNVRRTEHLDHAARYDLAEERRSAALAVARAYWSVRRLSLLRRVEVKAVERLVDAETTAVSRVRSGIAPPIDANRAKARRLLQEVAVGDLDGTLQVEAGRLATLLGLSEEVRLVDAPVSARPSPPALEILLEEARAERPGVLAARARLGAQDQAVDMALSGYYPQLSGFVLYQHGNNPALAGANSSAVFASTNPFRNLAGDLQLGVVLSINLFDTLNTYTDVEDARLEASRRAKDVERAGRVVETDVRVARAEVVRLLALIERLEGVRALADDNLTINRRRYEGGEAQVFELLDSEIELVDVERRLIEATVELTVAWLELDASLGMVVGEEA